MKKKFFMGIFLVILAIGLIYMIIINTVFNKNEEIINEYIPEVEISDSELRKTLITLYFPDNDGNLKSETRLIDSKELLIDPYKVLMGMLMEGPKDTNLVKTFPENTKVIDVKINKKCAIVNLSREFVDGSKDMDVAKKGNMINSLVNTLTELNEVQSVRFLIDGEEVDGFEEDTISLKNEYFRTEN